MDFIVHFAMSEIFHQKEHYIACIWSDDSHDHISEIFQVQNWSTSQAH